jgi:tetratricopeptide (TPR) repeat protein
MNKTSDKYKTIFICSALALTTLGVFWQVRSFDFINYDDDKYITNNEHISSGLNWNNIVWVFTNEHVGNWHPLTGLSHILDCQLFGLKPGPHHLVNLLFHIANTLLLFIVLRRMTAAFWQSAFVAALFALHPMHVQSVAWISERKDVLSTFFWILTMATYFSYTQKNTVARYILTLVLFATGLMAKPMLVTLPFVLLLLDFWPLNRMEPVNSRQIFCLVQEKIPFFTLSVVASIATFKVQKSGTAVQQIDLLPIIVRVNNAVISYATYLLKMIWPARLAIFYPHLETEIPIWQILTAAVLILGITVFVIRFTKKYRYLFVGWFWYMGTLVPVIGLVQVGAQAMADRYSYIPLIGLFIIVAWAANDLLISWKYRKAVLPVLSITVVLFLSVCTYLQTSYWQNSRTLFEHAVKVTNQNYIAYNNLGLTMLEQNKIEEAINLFQHALQIRPDLAEVYNNLGIALARQGKFDEAIAQLNTALQINPNYFDAYDGLSTFYGKLARYPEAIEACLHAVKIDPKNHLIYNRLGALYLRTKKYQQAIQAFQQAIRIKPDFAKAHYGLGIAYLQTGDKDSAMKEHEILKKLKADKTNIPVDPFNE